MEPGLQQAGDARELMDEVNASAYGSTPCLLNDLIDQLVLAVAEPTHRFGLRRVVRAFWEVPFA